MVKKPTPRSKVKMPVDAVVAVTYRCNSRCIMCNIWQIKDFPEMAPSEFSKLPKSLKDINISGGEPFLRNDLPEIIRIIKKTCPKAKISISTNGFLIDSIRRLMPKILKINPDTSVSVSIDGVGEMHEKVRRIPDAWNKVLTTVRYLRDEAKVKDIKLAFTLNKINANHLKSAYQASDRLNIGFTMAIAHSSDMFFSKENKLDISEETLKEDFGFVIDDLLKSFNPKDWARAYFIDGLFKVAKGNQRPLDSFAGEDFFYLDPKGDVYPSVIDNVIMGNIDDYSEFEALWYSNQAQEARDAVHGFESNYWMVCTARTAIKRNPLKVSNWIFKNRLNPRKWTHE